MKHLRLYRAENSLASFRVALSMAVALAATPLCSCSKTDSDKTAATASPGPTAAVSAAPVQSSSPAATYQLGTLISFAGASNSKPYRASGWSQPEVEFTWTEGNVATLKFSGLPRATALQLKTNLLALTNDPQLPSQSVEVYANQQKIAAWNVITKKEYSVTIPASAVGTDGTLTLEFRIPNATSPKALGQSNDSRLLGLCFFDLTIDKAP